MAPRFLLIVVVSLSFSMIAYTAAPPPPNLPVHQPREVIDTAPTNSSAPKYLTLLNTDNVPFKIPGTQTTLIFSHFSKVISQSELDLCVIEGITAIFNNVLDKGKDGFLPLNAVDYKYGNVVVNVYDFSAPAFRMTYASVVTTLRGIALFASMHGYYAVAFDVYEGKKGHVGTGEFGPIVPG